MKNKKILKRLKRHQRIKMKISGTKVRPRLVVRRSLENLYAQLIDDKQNKSLFSLSTLDKEIKQKFPYGGNAKAAAFFGEEFGRRAIELGFTKLVFDRAGYLYHGRVKAFSESLRKAGLEF